jgi:hypothetical protein
MPQLWEAPSQRGEQWHRTVIVLHAGRVHQEGEQEAPRVRDHWRLAASNPAQAATCCGFGALAANEAGRGNDIASDGLAGAPHQLAIDPPPDASIATVARAIRNGLPVQAPSKYELVINLKTASVLIGESATFLPTLRRGGGNGARSGPPPQCRDRRDTGDVPSFVEIGEAVAADDDTTRL